MARTPVFYEEKKALIIQAALASFAKHGYEGTTNKLIAQEAGKLIKEGGQPISPALIYHYFPKGKAELFAGCLAQLPPLQTIRQFLTDNLAEPPEVFLALVADTYNELLKKEGVLPIIRIVIAEGPSQPELFSAIFEVFGPNVLLPMIGYFERQIKTGKTRATTADQIGMQLFAPIFMRRTMLSLFPGRDMPFATNSDKEFLDTLVQTLLRGIFYQ